MIGCLVRPIQQRRHIGARAPALPGLLQALPGLILQHSLSQAASGHIGQPVRHCIETDVQMAIAPGARLRSA